MDASRTVDARWILVFYIDANWIVDWLNVNLVNGSSWVRIFLQQRFLANLMYARTETLVEPLQHVIDFYSLENS